MSIDLYLVFVILGFMAVTLLMNAEHFLILHFFQDKKSWLQTELKHFSKNHPDLCDEKDDFYCFFKKDVFSQK